MSCNRWSSSSIARSPWTDRPTRRIVALAWMVALGVLAAAAPCASAARAKPLAPICDTSWAAPLSGSWNDATMWTNGVPTATTNACIVQNGTYTVAVPGIAAAANTLQLGGTSGAPTLSIDGCDTGGDVSLTLANGGSSGPLDTIALTTVGTCNAGNVHLQVSSGTLTSSGTITTDPGTNGGTLRSLDGNIINQGAIDINVNAQYGTTQSGGTLENQGTINLAGGTQFYVNSNSNSTVSNDAGGSITNGTGNGYLYLDSGNTFDQGDGTVAPANPYPASPAVYLVASSLDYTGTGASAIIFRGIGSVSGDLASGQNLVLQGVDFCTGQQGSRATASADFTSAGTITLTKAGGCAGGPAELQVASGTLTNTGTIVADASASTQRELDGNVTNKGTIDINSNVVYDSILPGRTLANQGTINLATGTEFDVQGSSTVTNGTGGLITNGTGNGYLYLEPGDVFNQGAGRVVPASAVPRTPAVYVVASSLNYTGAGASAIVYRGVGALSGNLAARQNLVLQGLDACAGQVDVSLNAAGSFTNGGTITLTKAGSCGGGQVGLNIGGSGTLTNRGTLSAQLGSGATGRTLSGTLTNVGTVSVARNVELVLNGTLTNYSAASSTLTHGQYALSGVFQYTGAEFTATGIVNDAASVALAGTGKFLDANGTNALRGLASIAVGGTFSLSTPAFTTPGSLSNAGTLSLASGSTLTVNGSYTQSSGAIWREGTSSASKYGRLKASGPSSLAGTLALAAPAGFGAPTGSVLTPLSSATQTGTFALITGAGPGTRGKYFVTAYTPTGYTLTVHTAAITLTPNSGSAGAPFTVDGTGFSPGETVTIKFGTSTLIQAIADSSGNFSQPETAPSVPAGTYTVLAAGQTSSAAVAQPFTVT